jgi:hypothetical protein
LLSNCFNQATAIILKIPSPKTLQKIALGFIFGFVLGGCIYESIEPPKLPSVTRHVSFSGDIIPILTQIVIVADVTGGLGLSLI